ncbi:ATPase family AAA domain-containing protein FIGL1 [Linum grandiflorum]
MANARDASPSWRKQVDDNLNRLHSLKFGADRLLEKEDFSTSYMLGLRLIGFLDSHSLSDADEALTRPVRREALSKLDSARRALVPDSDRRAFERAGRDPGLVFGSKVDIDVEKVKQSKYFRALLQQYNVKPPSDMCHNDIFKLLKEDEANRKCGQYLAVLSPEIVSPVLYQCFSGNQLDEQQKSSCKPPKVSTLAKLTSLYGNSTTKSHGCIQRNSLAPKSKMHEDCMIVDNSPLYTNPRSRGTGPPNYVKIDEEEKVSGNPMGSKRSYMETRSPRNDNPKSPACKEESNIDGSGDGFVTARAKLEMEVRQKKGLTRSPNVCVSPQSDNINRGNGTRSYGYSRHGIRGNFVPPIRTNGGNSGNMSARVTGKNDDTIDDSTKKCMEMLCGPDGELPEKLRNLEPRLIEHVSNEIMDRDLNVRWNDIAGLEHAKKCVAEMVIWPLLRPDLFKGCRSPGKGLLLFGPPGTGKTMIGKAIAGEAKATFFYISASSLTSKLQMKWILLCIPRSSSCAGIWFGKVE